MNTPQRIAKLPRDKRGYHIPWFVAYVDGQPDFRIADAQKLKTAISQRRCWVCGEVLGRFLAYVIGPMCAINRVSSEPPNHRECAEYSVRTCPFMLNPKQKRNERTKPDDVAPIGGEMIDRNPGVNLLWITKDFRPFRVPNGILFDVAEPVEIAWYYEGRAATNAEILASIESGLPLLREIASREGPRAIADLERKLERAQKLVFPSAIESTYF